MADVAARVGVSRALVSLVFRDQPGASSSTRARVLEAAEELGYRPDAAAQQLARTRSQVLGVMITLQNPFHADLVEAMYPVAEQAGFDILLSATGPARSEQRAVGALLSHRCEALVLLGPNTEPEELDLLSRRSPVVAVGRPIPGLMLDTVHADEASGIGQAIDHLYELGHRHIVHIDGGGGPGSTERRQAYVANMVARGIGDRVRILSGDQQESSGWSAARTLVESDLPTAVLAGNDRCAVGLLDGLRRAGKAVPGDISVVGYDDSHLAHLSSIDLTTVRQDVEGTAHLTVRSALERIDDPRLEPRELVLRPHLVVRSTTAPPPH